MKRRLLVVLSIVILVVMCSVIFAACVPSKPDKAKAKLEKADFKVTVSDSNAANKIATTAVKALVEIEGSVTSVVQAIKGTSDSATITYFEKSKDAKAYANYLKDHNDNDKIVIKVTGKAVFSGTEAAWKAVK